MSFLMFFIFFSSTAVFADTVLVADEMTAATDVCATIPYNYVKEIAAFELLQSKAKQTPAPWPQSLIVELRDGARRLRELASPQFTSASVETVIRWSFLKEDKFPTDLTWQILKDRVRSQGLRSLDKTETRDFLRGPLVRFSGIEYDQAEYVGAPDPGQFNHLKVHWQKDLIAEEKVDRIIFQFRAVLSPIERCQLLASLRLTVKLNYRFRNDTNFEDGNFVYHLVTESI